MFSLDEMTRYVESINIRSENVILSSKIPQIVVGDDVVDIVDQHKLVNTYTNFIGLYDFEALCLENNLNQGSAGFKEILLFPIQFADKQWLLAKLFIERQILQLHIIDPMAILDLKSTVTDKLKHILLEAFEQSKSFTKTQFLFEINILQGTMTNNRPEYSGPAILSIMSQCSTLGDLQSINVNNNQIAEVISRQETPVEEEMLLKDINMQYWYTEDDIKLILQKSLNQKNLHIDKDGFVIFPESANKSVAICSPLVFPGSEQQTKVSLGFFNEIISNVLKKTNINLHRILLPLSVNGSHWCLAIFDMVTMTDHDDLRKVSELKVEIYDSSKDHKYLENYTDVLNSFIQESNIKSPPFIKIMNAKTQPDGCSCGVITAHNILCAIDGDAISIDGKYSIMEVASLRFTHNKLDSGLNARQKNNVADVQLKPKLSVEEIVRASELDSVLLSNYIIDLEEKFPDDSLMFIDLTSKLLISTKIAEAVNTTRTLRQIARINKIRIKIGLKTFDIDVDSADNANRENSKNLKAWFQARMNQDDLSAKDSVYSKLFSGLDQDNELTWCSEGRELFLTLSDLYLESLEVKDILKTTKHEPEQVLDDRVIKVVDFSLCDNIENKKGVDISLLFTGELRRGDGDLAYPHGHGTLNMCVKLKHEIVSGEFNHGAMPEINSHNSSAIGDTLLQEIVNMYYTKLDTLKAPEVTELKKPLLFTKFNQPVKPKARQRRFSALL